MSEGRPAAVSAFIWFARWLIIVAALIAFTFDSPIAGVYCVGILILCEIS